MFFHLLKFLALNHMLLRRLLFIQHAMLGFIGRLSHKVVLSEYLFCIIELSCLNIACTHILFHFRISWLPSFFANFIDKRCFHGRCFLGLVDLVIFIHRIRLHALISWVVSAVDNFLSEGFRFSPSLHEGVRLYVWLLLISDNCSTLVRLDLPDLIIVWARPQRRHSLHARQRGDGDWCLGLAKGRDWLWCDHIELLLC